PNLFDAADRYRRKTERYVRAGRRLRGLDLAAPSEHARDADRSEAERLRPSMPEKLLRSVDARDVAQDALAQLDAREILDVAPQRMLGVGASGEILAEERRESAHRLLLYVGGRAQLHGSSRFARRIGAGHRASTSSRSYVSGRKPTT